jgi:hypothetical protein
MTPQTPLEERLRDTLRRPEGAPWPDGRGAFDGSSASASAAAVLLPGVLLRGGSGQIAPVAPAGPVERNPARGFEVPLPDGWSKAEPTPSRRATSPSPGPTTARRAGPAPTATAIGC